MLQKKSRGWWSAIALLLLLYTPNFIEASPRSDRWRWSNPAPHGNSALDMKNLGGVICHVGDAGTFYDLDSSGRWTPAYTGVSSYLRSLALLGNRTVLVGERGTVLWSDDHQTFTDATLIPAVTVDWFESVASSPILAVAVGDYGMIYSSTDGETWNQRSSGTTEWLRGVAYGDGFFVAVGENGTILRSADGISWNVVASGISQHLNRVRYYESQGGGSFFVVGNQGVALSSSTGNAPWKDLGCGVTNDLNDIAVSGTSTLVVGDQEVLLRASSTGSWVSQITGLSGTSLPEWTYFSAIKKDDSNWIVTGRSGLHFEGKRDSSNAFAWSQRPVYSSRAWLWDATVERGTYIAVGDLGTIQTSLDGLQWTKETVPPVYSNAVWLGVGGTSNLLLAVGSNGQLIQSASEVVSISITNQSGSVTNIDVDTWGISWTGQPSFTTETLQGIAASDALYLVSGAQGSLFSSSTGSNWVKQTTTTTAFLSGVAMGSSECITVGSEGTLLKGTRDGTSWSAVSMGTTNWLYQVRWLNNQYLVVGQNGSIYTSPDGDNWTKRNSGVSSWLTDATYMDGVWYVSGYHGMLLSSSDLGVWNQHPLPTKKSLFGALHQNGQLVVVGTDGAILRNQIDPYLDPVLILDYSQTLIEESVGVTNMYELFLFGGHPDQVFDFKSTEDLSLNWNALKRVELYDPSGTLYLIKMTALTNVPSSSFYQVPLIP